MSKKYDNQHYNRDRATVVKIVMLHIHEYHSVVTFLFISMHAYEKERVKGTERPPSDCLVGYIVTDYQPMLLKLL